MVITQQHLVTEQGRQQLSLIVGQAAVPDLAVQLEQRFEPLVEGLHGLTTSAVDFLALAAGTKRAPLAATLPATVPDLGRLARGLVTTGVFRAQKPATRAPAVFAPFDRFAEGIIVIAAIRRDVDRVGRQVRDFRPE